MKQFHKVLHAILLTTTLVLTACSEDTGGLGIYPQQDAVSTSSDIFNVLSKDLFNNVNVPAGSTACYLGKVIDPETDKAIAATFAAQYHTFENYSFPRKEYIIPDRNGSLCESIEIRLNIKTIFGDKNNPMKLGVWPLSRDEAHLLKESETFYTDTDLRQYVDDPSADKVIATKVFTATDFLVSKAQRASDSYSNSVRIILPQKVGNDIMEAYYSHPEYFRDSYTFIRNVCAGFLFRIISGTGTMLSLEVSTLNLNFSYKDEKGEKISGLCQFAATPEVIQCTQFESNLDGLTGHSDYTMLKTPAGICTELILPVNEIYRGHENDSISSASLTLTRINNQEKDALSDDYALGIPQNLLLVRKQNFHSFFQAHQVADQQQAFTTAFSPTYNCYTFSNLSRLISYIQHEKTAGMRQQSLSEEEWEAAHPDWNRVVLIPVSISSATDAYGNTSQVSVNQDLSLSSTKLVRGTTENPIRMQVIYSRFAGN